MITSAGTGSGVTGFKFNSSYAAGTAGYIFGNNIVADGFTSYAIYVYDISNVRLNNVYATTTLTGAGTIYLYDAVQSSFSNVWVQNSEASGHAIEVAGS